ncbi:MAG: hypothetical protein JSS68_12320 [Actinobacteria bacterium]|nr:hypothetical protein [Actinomycetota bacterium]
MTPIHSNPNQPEDSAPRPAPQGSKHITIPFSYETSMEMGREGYVGVSPAELRRWADAARELDGRTTSWFGAGWALAGVSASFAVGALTVPSHAGSLGAVAGFLVCGAAVCAKAHRDLNRKYQTDADRLAGDIEKKIGSAYPPSGPKREGPPPPQARSSAR